MKKKVLIAKVLLVISSLVFYSWWNIIYLPLISFSIGLNFWIGYLLNKKIYKRKTVLTLGIVFNLSLLGYFKFYDFFIENLDLITGLDTPLLNLALPLAISFFTFQQIAYLVDTYKGLTKEYSFIDYALFVSFFPQLVAGPIVHHSEMMPQFKMRLESLKISENFAKGIYIFGIGLFKKVVIADTFAIWANNGYADAVSPSLFESWATSLSYTFQLYYDFSAYTDMAIGIALMFCIKLPINFNSPYKALTIEDFWRRWHITLSRFLRDYLYIPLGGNRGKELMTFRNVAITFLLGGLWHGAGWTFIVWGMLHGFAVIFHKLWTYLNLKLPKIIAWVITFNFINITWVFFRADSISQALDIIKGMLGLNGLLPEGVALIDVLRLHGTTVAKLSVFSNVNKYDMILYILISIAAIIALKGQNSNEKLNGFKVSYTSLIWSVFSILISLLFLNSISETEFLYFDF